MPKKRDLLAGLTRENLLALAQIYEVDLDRSSPKTALIESLASSLRLKTEGVEEIVARLAEMGDVPSAVLRSRQGFYEQNVVSLFDQVDSVGDSLSVTIAAYDVIDPSFAKRLAGQLAKIRNAPILQLGKVPDHIWSQLSPRQRVAFGVAMRLANQIPNFLEPAVQSSVDTDLIKARDAWKKRGLPQRIEYYVSQAYRSYIAGCYDASIVMIARALEHLLKRTLEKAGVPTSPSANLGRLLELHRQSIGNNAALEKILEVSNLDRNICAHDKPPHYKEMDKKDADHAWTALDIVLREIPA